MADVGSLKHILKEFYDSRVRVPEEDKQRNVKMMECRTEAFITAMKAVDPLFNGLYHRMFYAGSFYEGLKVSDADEFDLNIILKLPFETEDVEIVYNDVPAGYAQYRLKKPLEVILKRYPKWSVYQTLSSIMDGDCLSQKKINEWWQAVADKAIRQNCQFRELGEAHVNRARHGPALTYIIKPNETTVIEVDLVPVVELNEYPPTARQIFKPLDSPAFLVPKPTGTTATNDVTTLFRISIPIVEREVIKNMGCAKMLIRIFKAIRDNENWKFFASYYIKTAFLWRLERNHTVEHWAEDKLEQRFVEMLDQFIKVLEKKELKHFLFQEYNLISVINPDALDNMKCRLELYLDKSQKDLGTFKQLLYYRNS